MDITDFDGPILEIDQLSISFFTRLNVIPAVMDFSVAVQPGEAVGLVGESGCGKTTLSKVVMRALSADAGSVTYTDEEGETDVLALNGDDLTEFRQKVQFVFQDPFSSLNPRMTVFDLISEPLLIHNIGDDAWRREMVSELMRLVGLDIRHLRRYPHSFSGGQRQRIGIARALALKPKLLICDEPVSALDVSIQAQVLNLLKDLKQELNLTYMFITHNLAVVDYIADRIAVMCAGRLVELATRDELFANPVHPYTKALLSAAPVPDPTRKAKRMVLQGDVPSPINPPSGCHFHPRCPFAEKICSEVEPELTSEGEHRVACHIFGPS